MYIFVFSYLSKGSKFKNCLQAFGIFGLCQLVAFSNYLKSKMTEENFQLLFRSTLLVSAICAALIFALASLLGSKSFFKHFLYSKDYNTFNLFK